MKTQILFNLQPMSPVLEDNILKSLASNNTKRDLNEAYSYWLKQISNELNRSLTNEENKLIKSSFYATVYE
jgi:hypothetical protein